MASHQVELEAAGDVESILRSYDKASDSWKTPLVGNFWQALEHAHRLGRRGQGSRVAIIDTGCDTSIPRLMRQVATVHDLAVPPARGQQNGHGTAVALLICEVAPDCTLDIYNVAAEDGSIAEDDLIEAIALAAKSSATVINLSLGVPKGWHPQGDLASYQSWDNYFDHKREVVGELPPCPICAAASSAVEAGKIVFSAVGNERFNAYCPARADRVVAVGFQFYWSVAGELGMEIGQQAPVFKQALGTDLMLLQVPGALGSSFASPLYAGIAALGLTQDELWKYVASYAARVFPLFNNALVDTTMGGVSKAPQQILQEIDQGYWKSVSLLPHVHSEVHSNRLPHVPLTDPAGCPFCGVFADLQLINLGYWLYSKQQPLQALDVLKAARVLCPWSHRAIAFEGSALAMLGRYHDAVKNYEMAVRMQPGYAPYKAALQALETLAQFGQGQSSPGAEGSPFEFGRARYRELRRRNWIYYLVTAGLLSLHWSGAAHTVSRWLLLAPALVGLQQAYTCARRTRVADRHFHLVPDLETRRVLKMLGRLLRISRAGFAASAVGLLAFFFFP